MSDIAPYRPGAVAQASSDDGMVALWLDSMRSPATRQGYALDIRAFRAAVPKPLREIMVRDIQEYAATLGHLRPATVARRLNVVKSLIKMAFRLGYLPFDVGGPIQPPAVRDVLAERILTEETVQRLLWTAERGSRGHYARRNAVLLRLIYYAGLRISEACGLRWRDLTPRGDSGQIAVLGKGQKVRPILLPLAMWRRLLPLRGRAGPNDAVFRSQQGKALSRRQVDCIMKAAAKRARLPVEVSAHWLRHSHASHALDRGAPVHVVQTTLGHTSLTTTTKYTHARPDDSSAKYLAV